jgi:hypothetical protein
MIEKAIEQQLSPKYIIDLSKPFHVAWWAATLGVSEQDLVRAVNAVGTQATDVSCYLRQRAGCSVGGHSRHRSPDRLSGAERSRERESIPGDPSRSANV